VRRHLDLVYATALRKVEDAGGAEEIAQNVFSALARKAWLFAPDDSLPAWLHKTALLESKCWLRGELRRRRREQAAAELGTTMKTPDNQAAFHALVPLLDEALLSLRENDRTALLLRYYESQSLRQVGTAFAVSEDTAQKRVQSALEKLAEFFKRRGFKTATVTAAAAALQSTSVSTSATLAAVVSAALHVAPPALAGLAALLARLASLSRVQTAAVCVALVAAPIGLQLNERHAAGKEAKQIQTQLFAAQRDVAAALSELERMQANFDGLQQNAAQQKEETDRAAESARAFEVWKQKTRSQLTAADYRWDDDSPFVRIPKAVLPELSEFAGVELFAAPPPVGPSNSNVVEPFASELMGMTLAERRAVEDAVRRHYADLDRGREAGIYETNRSGQQLAIGETAKTFGLPAVPKEELQARGNWMLAELRGLLGEERWPLVEIRLQEKRRRYVWTPYDLRSILNLDSGMTAEELCVTVGTDEKGTPTWTATMSFGGVVGFQNGVLSNFLPEGDPRRTNPSGEFGGGLKNGLRQRAVTWLEEQATARVGTKEKP
jgi:RNA polymerase sigma factor (sigma-70 family)